MHIKDHNGTVRETKPNMGKQSDGWCRKLVVKRTTGGIKAPCAAKQRFQNKTGSGAVSVFVVSGFQKPLRRSAASGSFSRWFPPTASAQTAEAESWRTQVHTQTNKMYLFIKKIFIRQNHQVRKDDDDNSGDCDEGVLFLPRCGAPPV